MEEQERPPFSALYRRDFIGLLEALFEEGASLGEFRRINPRVAAMALLGILYPYMDADRGSAPVDPSIRADLSLIFSRGNLS